MQSATSHWLRLRFPGVPHISNHTLARYNNKWPQSCKGARGWVSFDLMRTLPVLPSMARAHERCAHCEHSVTRWGLICSSTHIHTSKPSPAHASGTLSTHTGFCSLASAACGHAHHTSRQAHTVSHQEEQSFHRGAQLYGSLVFLTRPTPRQRGARGGARSGAWRDLC